MAIRFYVDADLLGVAKLLTEVRSDVTYPGDPGGRNPNGLARPPCPIKPGEKDANWLPRVANEGWSSSLATATSNTVLPNETRCFPLVHACFASTPVTP